MDDKRIKQITTEMFVAWGLICAAFFILDLYWWKSGIIALNTSHAKPALSYAGFLSFFLVIISNTPAHFFSYCIIKVLFLPMQNILVQLFWLALFVIIQVFLYGYAGSLVGRFIVWIKQKFKSLRHQKQL